MILGFLAGCKSAPPPEPEPTRVELTIQAGAQINPNDTGRPSPLRIQIYELDGDSGFRAADYLELVNDPDAALGPELIRPPHKLSSMLVPGTQHVETLTLDKSTTHLGIVGGFMHYEKARTTLLLPIKRNADNKLRVSIDANGFTEGM